MDVSELSCCEKIPVQYCIPHAKSLRRERRVQNLIDNTIDETDAFLWENPSNISLSYLRKK
jgi:hypothetical protein